MIVAILLSSYLTGFVLTALLLFVLLEDIGVSGVALTFLEAASWPIVVPMWTVEIWRRRHDS